ncbi:Mitochondrial import inner membrane translocase subunit TIM44-2 [Gracilariopsis chorda]|uniref:Mitochondrial import inner membrane translocase subunit TIM44-2 n=1 Tax=Gracilariopsis chorda TaxID=448386 RepID=A0A2V3IWY1_9FLOR|nr:Mitochondrial import inner membrane translocase subunit TIM44-2 [Gracilariopsis chorda]|eukprot:PXF46664.1 Mitochondrial import inner membrane translocase subunit TIM44-2 [Gracilariopsis chorda]
MSALRRLIPSARALQRSVVTSCHRSHNIARCDRHKSLASIRWQTTLSQKSEEEPPVEEKPDLNSMQASQAEKRDDNGAESKEGKDQKPGAIGGFMRGLIGGQAVAVEDAFIAEAKKQGVNIPPPPPQRRADLVPIKRKKRQEEGDETDTIRDRIFGRFAGSAFMKGAFQAKERIQEHIDESDNPIINMFRSIYDRFFAENEMAMVVREIRDEEPSFRISEFLHQVETELVPRILGAYLRGDKQILKESCTGDAFEMLNASIRERATEGIVMDTNILDVGDVELTAAKLLEDSPVLIVTFNAQQINCLRNREGQVVEGQEDDIRAVYYAWAFAKEVEYEDFSPMGGGVGADEKEDESSEKKDEMDDGRPWKLMEMVIRGVHSTI